MGRVRALEGDLRRQGFGAGVDGGVVDARRVDWRNCASDELLDAICDEALLQGLVEMG